MLNALIPRSLASQVAAMLAGALVLSMALVVCLAAFASWIHMKEDIREENAHATRFVAAQLSQSYSGMNVSPYSQSTNDTPIIVWSRMPDFFRADLLDPVAEVSGMGARLYRFDADSGEFILRVDSVIDDAGDRGMGAVLQDGAIADALLQGLPANGAAQLDGALIVTHYQPIFDETGQTIGALSMGRDITHLQAEFWQTLMMEIAFAVIVALALVGLCTWMMRRAIQPLSAANTEISRLANGQLDRDMAYRHRRDEIGDIFNGLAVLQTSMREAKKLQDADIERSGMIAAKQEEQGIVVEALTEGLARLGRLDLTVQIESTADAPFPSDYEGLRTSFNMLVDSLSDSLDAIREVADEVRSDAQEMATSSSDLSGRTENQAATLEESAAALEELSASVQSTADNASDAEATTSENRAAAQRTGEVVEAAIAAMAAIEESSQKITQIISVIEDIAFQTNLLALNAGVEAARAGEAGRGFAVVASEVRALAQHSSASAQEIKELIASSSDHVETGSKLVRKAGDSLGDITDRVARVASLVSDIAVSAKEQSIGVSEINSGVRNLDAATQRNAAMAEEASAASEGLTNAANRLAEHLSRFQLSTRTAPPNWAVEATTTSPLHTEAADAEYAFGTPPRDHSLFQLNPQSQADVFKDF